MVGVEELLALQSSDEAVPLAQMSRNPTTKWIMLEFLQCPKWLDSASWLWHGSICYHRFYFREGWDASIEAVGSAASHTCTMNAHGHKS
jgi:hypothetical protein